MSMIVAVECQIHPFQTIVSSLLLCEMNTVPPIALQHLRLYSTSSVNVDTRQGSSRQRSTVAVFGYNEVAHPSANIIYNEVCIRQRRWLLNVNVVKGFRSFVKGFCLLLESFNAVNISLWSWLNNRQPYSSYVGTHIWMIGLAFLLFSSTNASKWHICIPSACVLMVFYDRLETV
jgi:hypothetical protein